MTQRRKRSETSRIVEFANPPAVEVALAVGFQPIDGLGVVELMQLWQDRFRRTLRKVQEQPPVQMQVEQFGSPKPGPVFRFELIEKPLVPRLWFLNDDESELVQIQNNWLARNWRKQETGPEYPHYPNIRGPFAADIAGIVEHVRKRKLGAFKPTQCELTYINHLPSDGSGKHLREVFALFAKRPPTGPLGEPESVRAGVQWIIQDDREAVGRLHITAEPAIRQADMKAVTVVTVTARGRPLGNGADGVLSFLDLGHEYAVGTFLAVTTDRMHREWGVRQ